MTYYVYILYDLLAQAGGDLQLYVNDDVAMRAVHDIVDSNPQLRKHIRDYDFRCIGQYDAEKGDLFTDQDHATWPKVILTGVQIASHLDGK